jgi:hypothetical protein
LSAVLAITPESLRRARDAEAAHLDAVLKVNGAKALRLSLVAERLRQSGAPEVELQANVGEEPQIWLDMSHRITMEPDTRTYRLSEYSTGKIEVLLETESSDEMLIAAQRVLSHSIIRQAWKAPESSQGARTWRLATLVYVWATGFIAGAAGLALLSIYLKQMPL